MKNLTLAELKKEARTFALAFSKLSIPNLYGVTDGKAVGTYVEQTFNQHLKKRYAYTQGSAAMGIDFPELNVDLKVTSIRQPQSSCPFRDATQKIYGLGYNLLVFVYDKADDLLSSSARLQIQHAIFIPSERTADWQTTSGLLGILERQGNRDDVIGFLIERNLPLDEIGREVLADRILSEPPKLGYLTISNALQWRLQYTRAINVAIEDATKELENLLG